MRKSLRQLIEDYLKKYYPNFIHKGELEKIAINVWGFEGDNCARRCRELEKKGIIIKMLDDKGRVLYKYNKNIMEIKHIMGAKQNSTNSNYDEQLRNILSKIKPTWDNASEIEKIGRAIKSNSEYLKKSIIQKYK